MLILMENQELFIRLNRQQVLYNQQYGIYKMIQNLGTLDENKLFQTIFISFSTVTLIWFLGNI